MTDKIFCLLSGGIDSTTTLSMALHDFPEANVECVTIDYGQRHKKEAEAAQEVVRHYRDVGKHDKRQISHHVIDAKGFMEGMLVDKADNEAIPEVSYADLPTGISPTYVTFRNGLMLSILAARAQAWVMAQQKTYNAKDHLTDEGVSETPPEYNAYMYCGVHADDGANWAYPDCTPEFIGAMANAIFIGTYNRVRLRAPIQYLSKAGVVSIGIGLDAPLDLTWSCYVGGEKHCGVCPTCRSRKEAFEILGLKDPTDYAA